MAPKASNEVTDKFVKDMLERAKKNEEVKPQSRSEGVDVNQVEKITENIRDRIQKRKY